MTRPSMESTSSSRRHRRLALLLAGSLAASTAVMAGPIKAQTVAAPVQSVNLPAGPLGPSLNALARQFGVALSIDAVSVANLTGAAVEGRLTFEEAANRLLTGSGLTIESTGKTAAVRRPAAGGASSSLPTVSIVAQAVGNELPAAYAGGQVARGGSLGLLGNTDAMSSSFSQVNYTAEQVRNTQAQSVGEVLDASASVRRAGSRFNQNDTYSIRGITAQVGTDIAYDGFYGLANTRRNPIEGLERVEILRGPNALLNGVPASGNVNGAINLVPKRPTSQPLTEFTLSYAQRGQVGGHLDLSRRFGPDDRFGVRINAVQREGRTTLDYNRERITLGNLSLDYLGDSLRVFAHLGYDEQKNVVPLFSNYTLAAGMPVPVAPDNSRNVLPTFNFTETRRKVGVLRAEYDINSGLTASVGYGRQQIDEVQVVSYGQRLLNHAGDLSRPTTNRYTQTTREGTVWDAKLSGRLQTGPVKHHLVLGYSHLDSAIPSYRGLLLGGTGVGSNIYTPNPNAEPTPDFSGGVAASLGGSINQGIAIADTMSLLDDRLLLTLGIRHQNVRALDGATGASTYDKSANSPALGLVFKPWSGWSLYGNYVEGLAQGPTAPATAANANEVFSPYLTKQREVGVKHDSGRILSTLALFEIKQPSAYTDPATNVFSSGGEQRNRGVEIESFGQVARGVRMIGGITYIDAILTRSATAAAQGKFATNVPRLAASATLEWDTPWMPGLTVTGRAIYNDKMYVDAANTQAIPTWVRTDFGLRYAFKVNGHEAIWRAFLLNAFDRNYYESARLWLGVPRTFTTSLSVRF